MKRILSLSLSALLALGLLTGVRRRSRPCPDGRLR